MNSLVKSMLTGIFGLIMLFTVQNVKAQNVYYHVFGFETQPIPYFKQYKQPQAVLTNILEVGCDMSKDDIKEYVYSWYETYCAKWTGYTTLRDVTIAGPYSYEYAQKTWNSTKKMFENASGGIYKGMFNLESPCKK